MRIDRSGCQRAVILALSAAPLFLGGCATFHQAHEHIHTANDESRQLLLQQRAMRGAPVVQTVDTPYLTGTVVPVRLSQNFPSAFHKTWQLATKQPLTLDQLATQITQMTGIPVHVASQVTGFLEGTNTMGGLPPLPGQVRGGMVLPNESSNRNSLSISWNGSLKGLLNLVAARTGTYWKYKDGEVRFFLTETKAFTVDALPGSTTMSANITNTGTNGGSAGGTTGTASAGNAGSTSQTATMDSSLDIYKSLVEGIKTVLAQSKSSGGGGGGGASMQIPTSVSANPSTGQIIVTATPPELRAVAEYLKPVNRQMSKNVLIEVHVYSVQLNNGDNYGLNLNAAFSDLGKRYGISFTGAGPVSTPSGSSSLSAAILNTATGALSQWSGGFTQSNGTAASPTGLLVQALATQGKVSLVTSGSVIALNGQPTPLQVAKQVSYVQSASTTQTANVGSSSTLTPGQFTTGFSGTFLPLVRGHRIFLEYSINLTQNEGIQTFTSGTTTIQLPNLAKQAFMQRVSIKSGETLVLSGFEQANNQVSRNGIGNARFFGLGGGANAINDRQVLVVVMHVVKLGG